MKKIKRKIPALRRDTSDNEIIRWTKDHDIFDRLEAGISEIVDDHSDLDKALHEAIFQDNTAQLNMRLPPAMKAVLSKLARQRTTDATTLARICWPNVWSRSSRRADNPLCIRRQVPTQSLFHPTRFYGSHLASVVK